MYAFPHSSFPTLHRIRIPSVIIPMPTTRQLQQSSSVQAKFIAKRQLGSDSVRCLLNPELDKPHPTRNHAKDNKQHLRRLAELNRLRKLEETKPKPQPKQNKTYAHTQSKIDTGRSSTSSSSSSSRSVTPLSISNSKSTSTATLKSKSIDKSVNKLTESISDIEIGVSYEKLEGIGQRDGGKDVLKKRVTKRGDVPEYLVKRKETWAKEQAEKMRKKKEAESCPPGTVIVPEADRIQTLKYLHETQDQLLKDLSKFRITLSSSNVRMTQKKHEVEARLDEVEKAIQVYSQKKVFMSKG